MQSYVLLKNEPTYCRGHIWLVIYLHWRDQTSATDLDQPNQRGSRTPKQWNVYVQDFTRNQLPEISYQKPQV